MKANINIDYLILNLKLNNPDQDWDSLRNERFSFLFLRYGTKNFQKIGEIYYNGSHFATLTFCPHDNSIMKKDFSQLQLVNKFLYQPKRWLERTVIEMLSFFDMEVTGVNRLDLAMDGLIGEVFYNDLPYLHPMVTYTEKYLICGKEKDFNLYSTTKGCVKGWTLGSRSGDRFLRFYNKSKEIEQNPKPWIHSYWKYNIEFTSEEMKRVWRLEYQLNRRFLRSIDSENWTSIFNQSFINVTFVSANHGFMDIRMNTHVSRPTNNPKINMVDIDFILQKTTKDEVFQMNHRPESIYEGKKIRELKMTMKKLFWIYWRGMQESSLSLVFVNKIMDCNRVFFEDMFFNKKILLWVAEFQEKEKLTYDFDYEIMNRDIKMTAGIEI